MTTDMQSKIEYFRRDYAQTYGQPFRHFFCPILFVDEDVSLCKAHIVNLAFAESARDWTVQRTDVDNFFGAMFEADFVGIGYYEDRNPGNTVTDKKLSKLFAPKFLVDGEPVEFFVTNGEIPERYTGVEFDNDGETIRLALKISPEDMLAATEKNWEIAISKDVRVPALVSLLKAAHLTLFEMLGYDYALSVGGHFIGRRIIGEFFLRNRGKPKDEVRENAYTFFRKFAHMIRPVQSSGYSFQGTISDRTLLICRESHGIAWALIVFIRTSRSLHAVLVPVMDHPLAEAEFIRFLDNDDDSIEAVAARFEGDHWVAAKNSIRLLWPKSGVLYP